MATLKQDINSVAPSKPCAWDYAADLYIEWQQKHVKTNYFAYW